MVIAMLDMLKLEMEKEAGKLLDFWERFAPHKDGYGFFGVVNAELQQQSEASKHLVLSSRLIWTFSSAYRLLKLDSYRIMAQRAYIFFIDNFIDRRFGGAYWEINHDGSVKDGSKRIYGQAFAVYALSEYFRTFGDEKALREAEGIYNCIEKYALDIDNGGYYEALTEDWKFVQENQKSNINPHEETCKTMNTHLHLLEAYTNLYRVWKSEGLKIRLKECIGVMTDKILNTFNWHFMMYFNREWTSCSEEVSYGHDIEGSWLLWEAAEVLGDEDIKKAVMKVSIRMSQAVLQEGWHKDGGILYEAGPEGIINPCRSWWVQAEAVVGFFNSWQLTSEEKYFDAAMSVWEFIKKELIDHENGGWFSYAVSDKRTANRIDGWTCPYHNGRMCFEIIERIQLGQLK